MARYILLRLGEEFGLDIELGPKPIRENFNGSGCHMNYSTNETRAIDGYKVIEHEHIPKLSKTHKEHLLVYGEGN